MKPIRLPIIACAIVGLLCVASSASAQLVFQPTSEATSKDSKLYEHVPTSGLQSDLSVTSPDIGAYFTSILQFDLSTYGPINASLITSAYITLNISGLGISGGPAVGGTVTMSPILNGWRENATDPGTDPVGSYTAFYGTVPTITYGSAVASQVVTGAGFYSWDITDLVKSWANGTLANNGVMIQLSSLGGDVGISDVDSDGPAKAPSLTIVPEPGAISLLGGAGLFFLLRRRTRYQAI